MKLKITQRVTQYASTIDGNFNQAFPRRPAQQALIQQVFSVFRESTYDNHMAGATEPFWENIGSFDTKEEADEFVTFIVNNVMEDQIIEV